MPILFRFVPFLLAGSALASAAGPSAVVTGEPKQWHEVTLTLDGPFARERDTDPGPFLDCRLTVRFRHESGAPSYEVPGYFAADGNASRSGGWSPRTPWSATRTRSTSCMQCLQRMRALEGRTSWQARSVR